MREFRAALSGNILCIFTESVVTMFEDSLLLRTVHCPVDTPLACGFQNSNFVVIGREAIFQISTAVAANGVTVQAPECHFAVMSETQWAFCNAECARIVDCSTHEVVQCIDGHYTLVALSDEHVALANDTSLFVVNRNETLSHPVADICDLRAFGRFVCVSSQVQSGFEASVFKIDEGKILHCGCVSTVSTPRFIPSELWCSVLDTGRGEWRQTLVSPDETTTGTMWIDPLFGEVEFLVAFPTAASCDAWCVARFQSGITAMLRIELNNRVHVETLLLCEQFEISHVGCDACLLTGKSLAVTVRPNGSTPIVRVDTVESVDTTNFLPVLSHRTKFSTSQMGMTCSATFQLGSMTLSCCDFTSGDTRTLAIDSVSEMFANDTHVFVLKNDSVFVVEWATMGLQQIVARAHQHVTSFCVVRGALVMLSNGSVIVSALPQQLSCGDNIIRRLNASCERGDWTSVVKQTMTLCGDCLSDEISIIVSRSLESRFRSIGESPDVIPEASTTLESACDALLSSTIIELGERQTDVLCLIDCLRRNWLTLTSTSDVCIRRTLLHFFVCESRRLLKLKAEPLSSFDCLWLLISDNQESFLRNSLSASPTWDECRSLKLSLWCRNVATLQQTVEKIAKLQFQKSREVRDCAFMYCLAGRKNVLAALCKACNDMRLHQFFSRDFSDEKNRSAAISNAYVAIGKGNILFGVAFFILAGEGKNAAHVILDRVGDFELATLVVRLLSKDDSDTLLWLLGEAEKSTLAGLSERASLLWLAGQPTSALQLVTSNSSPTQFSEAIELADHCNRNVAVTSKRKDLFLSKTREREMRVALHRLGEVTLSADDGVESFSRPVCEIPQFNWFDALRLPSEPRIVECLKSALKLPATLCSSPPMIAVILAQWACAHQDFVLATGVLTSLIRWEIEGCTSSVEVFLHDVGGKKRQALSNEALQVASSTVTLDLASFYICHRVVHHILQQSSTSEHAEALHVTFFNLIRSEHRIINKIQHPSIDSSPRGFGLLRHLQLQFLQGPHDCFSFVRASFDCLESVPNEMTQFWMTQIDMSASSGDCPHQRELMATIQSVDEKFLQWTRWSCRNVSNETLRKFRASLRDSSLTIRTEVTRSDHAVCGIVHDHSTFDSVAVATHAGVQVLHGLRDTLSGDNEHFTQRLALTRNTAMKSFSRSLEALTLSSEHSSYIATRPPLGASAGVKLVAHPHLPFFVSLHRDGSLDVLSFGDESCCSSARIPDDITDRNLTEPSFSSCGHVMSCGVIASGEVLTWRFDDIVKERLLSPSFPLRRIRAFAEGCTAVKHIPSRRSLLLCGGFDGAAQVVKRACTPTNNFVRVVDTLVTRNIVLSSSVPHPVDFLLFSSQHQRSLLLSNRGECTIFDLRHGNVVETVSILANCVQPQPKSVITITTAAYCEENDLVAFGCSHGRIVTSSHQLFEGNTETTQIHDLVPAQTITRPIAVTCLSPTPSSLLFGLGDGKVGAAHFLPSF